MKRKIKVVNHFHGVESYVYVLPTQIRADQAIVLSGRQYSRLRRKLCTSDCYCFHAFTVGHLGGQYYKLEKSPA